MFEHLRDLIIVACHAPFAATTERVPEDPTRDDGWVLQEFQKGEPPFYIEHIRHGVSLAAANPQAMLMFSGGYTRVAAGKRWSEAATYRAIAEHFGWWTSAEDASALAARSVGEDYSRDSFENLLFSVCSYERLTGNYPRHITMVSWGFKHERFDMHRDAIGFPATRFAFSGCGEPRDPAAALRGEAAARAAFARDPFGTSGELVRKREARNPLKRDHPFRDCRGMKRFFAFIESGATSLSAYAHPLPWR